MLRAVGGTSGAKDVALNAKLALYTDDVTTEGVSVDINIVAAV